MASELTCETCGLSVPSETGVCPRDGTVALASFSVPDPAGDEPKVVVQPGTEDAASAEAARDPLIGLKLGEYELRGRIGVGGMGLVYDGIQPLIGKKVAVKVLRPELAHSAEQVARLLAEARAVNAIRHRGIIDIFGFGQLPDGRQYMVMEFLDGQPLDAVLSEKGRLPVSEALSILDEVLAGLAAAHGAGVVHRDLKPSNIFLVRQPDGSRYVKLLDFGLAKRGEGPTGRTAQTRTDMVVGTPEYMAPEQARGQEVGPMTDLYAMGVVTFEMVTGRLPFVGSSPVDLLMKHVEARPPRPSEFEPELPPALDAFVLQMLTKDPETRPNSADTLRQQLNRLRRTLRATRTNPTAPAPVEPSAKKPAREDDADSRRPTTQVPAPIPLELTSQEVRSVRSPLRRLVPAGLGVAALLVAAGIVIATRGASTASAGQGTPAQGQAGAGTTGAGTPPAPAAPMGAVTGAPQPPGQGAPTGVATGSPAAAVPPGAGQAPAATGAPGAAPETGVPAANPGVAPQAIAAAPPGTTGATPGSTGTAAANPSAAVAPPASAAAPTGPSKAELHSRIRRLERELEPIAPVGTPKGNTARNLLEKLRVRTNESRSDTSRRQLAVELSYWEKTFLKR